MLRQIGETGEDPGIAVDREGFHLVVADAYQPGDVLRRLAHIAEVSVPFRRAVALLGGVAIVGPRRLAQGCRAAAGVAQVAGHNGEGRAIGQESLATTEAVLAASYSSPVAQKVKFPTVEGAVVKKADGFQVVPLLLLTW